MSDFNIKLLLIIIGIIIAIIIFKEIIAIKKYHRVTKNSLRKHSNNCIIEPLSSFLRKIVVFNSLAEKYNDYTSSKNKILKKGMDVISLKIVLLIISIITYIIISLIINKEISPYVMILFMIISFCVPDIVISYKNQHQDIIEEKYLEILLDIDKRLKEGKSINEAINDLEEYDSLFKKKEISIIKNDIKLGLSLAESVRKASIRLKSEILNEIYIVLNQVKNKIDYELLFKMIEDAINTYQNIKKETNVIINEKKNMSYILAFIPIITSITFIILMYPMINNFEITLITIMLEIMIYLVYITINNYLIKHRTKSTNKEIEYIFKTILINLKKENNLKKSISDTINSLDNKITHYLKDYINVITYDTFFIKTLDKLNEKNKQLAITEIITYIKECEQENKVDISILEEKIFKLEERNNKETFRKMRNIKMLILLNSILASIVIIVPTIIMAK